ncbi:MAG: diacylglycerol kinase family protein [Candidatus Delongbacteria bacterium]|jgi:diacylglycerol kinase|nr:diacylglycerol kinase family protein [Candidatus Delongbacteria bacterium]
MNSRKSEGNFIVKRLNSFRFASKGFVTMVKEEANFRIQLIILIIIISLGFFFSISGHEWIHIILASGFVIMAEILNSAVERIADFLSPEFDEAIGSIKDICAAAVLVAASISVVIGLIIFIPKFLS